MHTAVFLVSNIHCPSCVSYAQDVLHRVAGVQLPADISVINQTIRAQYDQSVVSPRSITDTLLQAAFEVHHVTILDDNSTLIQSFEAKTSSGIEHDRWRVGLRRKEQSHIDYCTACQREMAKKPSKQRKWATAMHLKKALSPSPSVLSGATEITAVDSPAVIDIDGTAESRREAGDVNIATISIDGMTCTSCSNVITQGLNRLDFVISVDVNLVSNFATVAYCKSEVNSSRLVEEIEDLGYEATIDHIQEQADQSDRLHKATLSIGGMTCSSCVSSISTALGKVPNVSSVSIDLVGASGTVEFSNRQTLDQILDVINDLGYEASLVSLTESTLPKARPTQRQVQLQVDGMYCSHCPDRIEEALNQLKLSSGNFDVTTMPDVKVPRISIRYKPSPATGLSIRSFISTLQLVNSSFHVSVYEPPSLEERTKVLQSKEKRFILRRLIFSAIVAVPTLIIGVIFMMAVSSTNSTRRWLEEPMWAGSAMRGEWALLIMTTPVMFYGTDLFHRRAFKDIWAMWKPASKVPLLRRFYRFGSMNLLISAATMVAYFASLAVLIMNSRASPSHHMDERSSSTYFDTVTFLTFFLLIGRFLEAYSKAKTGDAVSALAQLRPTDALLVEDGLKRTPVDQLEIGDIVQIPHGHSPPTDGTIEQQGTFSFDESSLTGESKPVKKSQGDTVFTGTVNVTHPVKIRVTEVGGTSVLDKIIQVVREGQAKRAPAERVADVLTAYFVPVITLLAVTTWLIWLGLGLGGHLPRAWLDVRQGGWAFWSLEFAIAVFVVACPCGIGLAAPTALFVGGGIAAKNGILVQGGGEAFQEASKLNTIVFDKTGTLTEGYMKVTHFETISTDVSTDFVLAVAKCMEEASTHPIAKAIAQYCRKPSTKLGDVAIQEVPGLGMKAKFEVNGQPYEAVIGNEKLLSSSNEFAIPVDNSVRDEKHENLIILQEKHSSSNVFLSTALQSHQSKGHSTAILAMRSLAASTTPSSLPPFTPTAIFAISDPIRLEAHSVIDSLRHRGVEIHMCTGDNPATAMAVASQLNIPPTHVRAGVMPEGKAEYITELQTNHPTDNSTSSARTRYNPRKRIVAFVGDGTNDTPALTSANISIALSSASDIALTSSSFILLNSNLTANLTLLTLSRRVFRRVLLNFGWACVYNLTLVPIAAGVLFPLGASETQGGWRLSPVWAAVAMAGSSVSVVLSSLALRLPEFTFHGVRESVSGWMMGRRGEGVS